MVQALMQMQPRVRDLLKRLLIVGRDYPNPNPDKYSSGLDFIKKKASPWLAQNQDLTEDVEIRKAVATGRFYVREMQAVIQFKKYRAMQKSYNLYK